MKNNFWAKSNGVSLGQHIADVLQGIDTASREAGGCP